MKILVVLMFCIACGSTLDYLNNAFIRGEALKKVECYMPSGYMESNTEVDIEKYFNSSSVFFTILDNSLVSNFNQIFMNRSIVEREVFITPREKIYSIYVLYFLDGTKVALLSSSSFGLNQFSLVDFSHDENGVHLKKINLSIKTSDKNIDLAIFLPDFNNSSFLKEAIRQKTQLKKLTNSIDSAKPFEKE